MTNDLAKGDLQAHAKRERKSAQQELFEDLKTKPKSDLFKTDPALLARLTPHQRAELFSVRSNSPLETPSISKGADERSYRQISRLRKVWNKIPLGFRSTGVGLFTLLVFNTFSYGLLNNEHWLRSQVTIPQHISKNANNWPNCSRLTPHTDACVYRVTHQLSWSRASRELAITTQDLADTNTHLSTTRPLERSDKLIVWRNQLSLED